MWVYNFSGARREQGGGVSPCEYGAENEARRKRGRSEATASVAACTSHALLLEIAHVVGACVAAACLVARSVFRAHVAVALTPAEPAACICSDHHRTSQCLIIITSISITIIIIMMGMLKIIMMTTFH